MLEKENYLKVLKKIHNWQRESLYQMIFLVKSYYGSLKYLTLFFNSNHIIFGKLEILKEKAIFIDRGFFNKNLQICKLQIFMD